MKTLKARTNYLINNATACFCFLFIISISNYIQAAEINVTSIQALQSAINNSRTGDVIILANGTYRDNTLNIAKNKITVRAATPGGVFLNGANAINISGDNVIFSGFQFTSGFPFGSLNKVVINVTGDRVVLTQLNFSGYNASKYINLQGQYDEISYCNFENKPETSINNSEKGNMIHIAERSNLTPNYAKISYCSFQNMPGSGGDYGNECIRITNHEIPEPGSYKSKTIVEYCYFTNTGLGDGEAISVKSDNNILRYNTMIDNQTANFVFRYGDDNVAYGNFFINSGGIRIKEANNIHCYNNYFENSGNGSASAPFIFAYDNTSVVSHLNYLNIVNNTFVGGSEIELNNFSPTNNGNVPITTFTNNTFANNIFKYATGKIFSGSTSGISWAGNFRQGTLGITNPSLGMENKDSILTLNSEGYFGIPSNSPAIDASSTSYPAILDIADIDDDPYLLSDISRQTRVGIKDVGCDEYSTGTISNRPLTLADVGPSYLVVPLAVDSNEMINSDNAIVIFPSLAKNEITIKTSSAIGNLLSVSIYNLIGQKVKMDTDLQNQGGYNRYDVSDLNNGIYFVKVTSKEFSKTMKLVIQK